MLRSGPGAAVRRHLCTLRIGLEADYPEEDWGFTAQQAAEKLLKAWIVLAALAEQPHGRRP